MKLKIQKIIILKINQIHILGLYQNIYIGVFDNNSLEPYSVFIMLTTKKQENQQNIYFLIGNSPISWKSQLQKCVTLSTAEAEFVSITKCTKHGIWLQK